MTEFIIDEDFPESEIEFEERFHSEDACREYLFDKRWPDGFRCSRCGHDRYWQASRDRLMCTNCEHQHTLTAGTIMHGSKKPLRYWFKAMWWFTTRKSGVNAVNLKELLGFGSYSTAWTWLQKLRCCTVRPERTKLSGDVVVDEFYVGGQKPGKRGRGANGKTIVIAAVEDCGEYLGRARLQVVPDCSANTINIFFDQNIGDQSSTLSDGWRGYSGVDEQRYTHRQEVQDYHLDNINGLTPVHLVASLVKRLIRGTFQGRFGPKYLQNYLDEYVFRFNRRNSRSIGKKFMRIVEQVASSTKITYEQIRESAERSYPWLAELESSG